MGLHLAVSTGFEWLGWPVPRSDIHYLDWIEIKGHMLAPIEGLSSIFKWPIVTFAFFGIVTAIVLCISDLIAFLLTSILSRMSLSFLFSSHLHRDTLCSLNMEVFKPHWHYIPQLCLLTFYFRNSITKISIPFLINNQLSIFSNLTFPINHPVSPLSYYIKNPFSTISQSHSLIPSIEYLPLRYKNCAEW